MTTGKERNTVGHLRVRGQRSRSDIYREREQPETDQRTYDKYTDSESEIHSRRQRSNRIKIAPKKLKNELGKA